MADTAALNRRKFLKTICGLAVLSGLPLTALGEFKDQPFKKNIPSTGELIPAVGMGTWITFDVGNDIQARNQRTRVLDTFFRLGGGLVDSSPMYGSSEEVLGYALDRLGRPQHTLFSASKVWTPFAGYGKRQIKSSFKLWGLEQFDLFQVHNLLNWEKHLATLMQYKQQGLIRYIGVTTSHGRRHTELEKIINSQAIDFVQLTYNILDRDVEQRLLPAAQEKGIAVIANRPFQGGSLFLKFSHKPLPGWAKEIDCQNWAQFFLKFIISHPAVTCAIPATSKVEHMMENMGALQGRQADTAIRRKMIDYIAIL